MSNRINFRALDERLRKPRLSPLAQYAYECFQMLAGTLPLLTHAQIEKHFDVISTIMTTGLVCGDTVVETCRQVALWYFDNGIDVEDDGEEVTHDA